MGKTVTKISEARILKPRQELISHLDNLLDNAKTGELTGLISVSLWQGGHAAHGYSLRNGDFIRTLIGEVEILKHALIDQERHISGEAATYE
jgi:hypothetical protein